MAMILSSFTSSYLTQVMTIRLIFKNFICFREIIAIVRKKG